MANLLASPVVLGAIFALLLARWCVAWFDWVASLWFAGPLADLDAWAA